MSESKQNDSLAWALSVCERHQSLTRITRDVWDSPWYDRNSNPLRAARPEWTLVKKSDISDEPSFRQNISPPQASGPACNGADFPAVPKAKEDVKTTTVNMTRAGVINGDAKVVGVTSLDAKVVVGIPNADPKMVGDEPKKVVGATKGKAKVVYDSPTEERPKLSLKVWLILMALIVAFQMLMLRGEELRHRETRAAEATAQMSVPVRTGLGSRIKALFKGSEMIPKVQPHPIAVRTGLGDKIKAWFGYSSGNVRKGANGMSKRVFSVET